MINSISGKIFKKEPTTLYIENNGIVFSISICLRDYEKLPSENENIFIPKGALHRIANKGSKDLIIIEMWYGEILDENDIKRYDENYNII